MKKLVHQVLQEKQALSVKDLKINGHDLRELGVREGKEIGKILELLLEGVLEDESLNSKEKLLELAKEAIHSGMNTSEM